MPGEMTNVDKSYAISEVAEKLNLAPKTLRRWEEAGKFKATRTVGGQRRYSIEDLQVLDAIKHGTIPHSDDLLSIEQAAGLFGVTPQTLQRWENQGKIHPFITAGNTYYPKSHLVPKIEELKNSYQEQVKEPVIRNLYSAPKPPTPPIQSPEPSPRSHYATTHEPENIEEQHPRAQLDLRRKLKPLKIEPSATTQLPQVAQPKIRSNNLQRTLLTATLINLLITVGLIGGYHALTSQETQSPAGQVKGVTEQQSPLDKTLQSILDITGNLNTPGTITTKDSLAVGKALTFSPTSITNPTPGTLYYDAATQTLKLYTRGAWHDFPAASDIPLPKGSIFQSGLATIPKGQKELTVTDSAIALDSHITVTFLDDYSPAKKYWLTQANGSFTLQTDFPVGQNADFTYLILTSQDEVLDDTNEATTSGIVQ